MGDIYSNWDEISEDFINFDFYRVNNVYDEGAPGYAPDQYFWTGLPGLRIVFILYVLARITVASFRGEQRVDLENKSVFLILSGAGYHLHQLAPIACARRHESVVLTRREHLSKIRKHCGEEVVCVTFAQLLGHAKLSTIVSAVRDFRTWKRTLDANADTLSKGRLDYMFVLICLSNVFGTHGASIDSVHMSAIRSYVVRAIPSEKIFLYQHGLHWWKSEYLHKLGFHCNYVVWGEAHITQDETGQMLYGNPWHERLIEQRVQTPVSEEKVMRCLFFSDFFTWTRLEQDDLAGRYLDALRRFAAQEWCEMMLKLHPSRESIEDLPEAWLREHAVTGPMDNIIHTADVTISNHSSASLESLVAGVPTILINEEDRASEHIPESIRELDGVRILDGLDDLSPDVARQHADVDVDVAELREAGIVGEADIVDRVWARVDAVR